MDFLYGDIAAEIPSEFTPVEAWPEYGYIAGLAPICRSEYVAGNYNALRWSVWPLCFEQYIGDTNPDLEQSKRGELTYNRFVMWRRTVRADIPKGWTALSKKPSQIDGFRMLHGGVTDSWHKNARRDLRLWREHHEDKTHTIERIDFAEYERAYLGSLIAKRVDTERIKYLRRKLTLPLIQPYTELWGVRDLTTGKVIAGTALIHSPTYRGSTHFAPFIHAEARRVYAATALTYHWFRRAQEHGSIFVVTTNFWFPGKPKSWKGFSEFKSHFGWQYIAYPPTLWRFERGKLW